GRQSLSAANFPAYHSLLDAASAPRRVLFDVDAAIAICKGCVLFSNAKKSKPPLVNLTADAGTLLAFNAAFFADLLCGVRIGTLTLDFNFSAEVERPLHFRTNADPGALYERRALLMPVFLPEGAEPSPRWNLDEFIKPIE